MSTVKVIDLVNKAQTMLQDTTSTRWPQDELVGWLNDAYREIILARPDANSESATFSCKAGTRQRLTDEFPNALRLMDVVRNTASGSSMGAVRLIDRTILDDQRRGWHAEDQAISIEHFIFDPKLPREFLVYPPSSDQAKIEVVFSSVPTDHDPNVDYNASAETIKIVDSYANAILDYVLYRAYSKDAEYAANAQRAVNHYQAMQQALGIKTKSDDSATPKDLEALARAVSAARQQG